MSNNNNKFNLLVDGFYHSFDVATVSRTWTPFVANRVGEIQQLTTIQDWHHISSQDNPADLLFRGVPPASLSQSQLWWSGPSWLTHDKNEWPQVRIVIQQQDLPEFKSVTISIIATQNVLDIFECYSNLMRLLRVVAYMFRFINRIKQQIKLTKGSPSFTNINYHILPNEINHATKVLVKLVQRSYFSKELSLLLKQQNLNKNSPILRLNLFIDKEGILRVGGRLKLSDLTYNTKHPILLPGHHPFARLIVTNEHERHFYAGPQATLAAVRQNYWLISARDVVRQITRKCTICFRSAPKTMSTLMGNLPKAGITVPSRIFEKCGIDYAGPFYYKDGSRKTAKLLKCYMAIFVCFATTAVHIELATDLSTEAFLNVLKRFISRRDYPSDIYSDNSLNFVGAERELNELVALFKSQDSQQQINHFTTSKGINWHFITPRAPHHGGLWEAVVKGAKRHLLRITKKPI